MRCQFKYFEIRCAGFAGMRTFINDTIHVTRTLWLSDQRRRDISGIFYGQVHDSRTIQVSTCHAVIQGAQTNAEAALLGRKNTKIQRHEARQFSQIQCQLQPTPAFKIITLPRVGMNHLSVNLIVILAKPVLNTSCVLASHDGHQHTSLDKAPSDRVHNVVALKHGNAGNGLRHDEQPRWGIGRIGADDGKVDVEVRVRRHKLRAIGGRGGARRVAAASRLGRTKNDGDGLLGKVAAVGGAHPADPDLAHGVPVVVEDAPRRVADEEVPVDGPGLGAGVEALAGGVYDVDVAVAARDQRTDAVGSTRGTSS